MALAKCRLPRMVDAHIKMMQSVVGINPDFWNNAGISSIAGPVRKLIAMLMDPRVPYSPGGAFLKLAWKSPSCSPGGKEELITSKEDSSFPCPIAKSMLWFTRFEAVDSTTQAEYPGKIERIFACSIFFFSVSGRINLYYWGKIERIFARSICFLFGIGKNQFISLKGIFCAF